MGTRLVLALVLAFQFGYPHPYRQSVNPDDRLRDVAYDGVIFCRLQFDSNRSELGGMGWSTDFPRAGRNLRIRTSELTTVRAVPDPQLISVVEAGSPLLWRCPFLMASDVGTAVFSEAEQANLRDYFARGGFLWADDFWGLRAWDQWIDALSVILPAMQLVELTPAHAVYHMLYRIRELPQVSHLSFWSEHGQTSERGEESPQGELWAAYAASGRIAAVIDLQYRHRRRQRARGGLLGVFRRVRRPRVCHGDQYRSLRAHPLGVKFMTGRPLPATLRGTIVAVYVMALACAAHQPVTPVSVTRQATEIVKLIADAQEITIAAWEADLLTPEQTIALMTVVGHALKEADKLPAVVRAWAAAEGASVALEQARVRRILFTVGQILSDADVTVFTPELQVAFAAVLTTISSYILTVGGA